MVSRWFAVVLVLDFYLTSFSDTDRDVRDSVCALGLQTPTVGQSVTIQMILWAHLLGTSTVSFVPFVIGC